MTATMTAGDVRAALASHWLDDRYLHVYEAPLDHGRQGCKIDVLVMGLWASKGHQLDAVEIKVSYSDWCKEWRRSEWILTDHTGKEIRYYVKPNDVVLRRYRGEDEYVNAYLRARGREDEVPPDGFEPTVERRHHVDVSKNEAWRKHAHRFWIAAPEALAKKIAVDVATIPELAGWGVLAASEGGCTVLVAPKRSLSPKLLTHQQYLGIIRSAADSGVQAIWRAEARGRATGLRDARANEDRLRQSMWSRVVWEVSRDGATA